MSDVTKVLYCVKINAFFSKMEYYGIYGTELQLFASYLTYIKQYVSVGSKQTSLLSISKGVPQGSVLGHLLFSIYIYDLPTAINYRSSKITQH